MSITLQGLKNVIIIPDERIVVARVLIAIAPSTLLMLQILETSSSIDPTTLALSNAPRGGEELVKNITGDLKSLGIG